MEYDEKDEQAQLEESRRHALRRLGQTLSSRKDKCVDNKSDVEARWLRDERQYWGVNWNSDIDRTVGKAQISDEYQISDKKTMQKTRTIAARLGDMLFPTNEKNWALEPTRLPTDIDGNPVDPAQAEDAAERAEDKIEDYLQECDFPKAGRKAIFDGCRIGTGVLKGPFSKGRTKRVMRRQQVQATDEFGQPMFNEFGQPVLDTITELQSVTETAPAVARVDPWMWFPAPARNVEECEYSFELHLKTRDGLREMSRYPGFDEDAIRRLIEAEPAHGAERGLLQQRRDLLRSNNESLANTYTVWEYHGPIDREDLRAIGIDLEDPLDSVFAEVWICQNEVLKVELSAVVDDHRVPYYVWCYEEDEADIFGYGVPYVMRDEQELLDALVNAMRRNAELTAGPQTVEWKGKVTPGDGSREIRGPKHWIVDDENMGDFREAIQFHYVESSIGAMLPLYQLAQENADQNTMLPMMAQGEATNSVPTASGMAMLMNASNIVQRLAAHSWDDNITIPMITRFYYWLMQYDEDDSIKLDMNIEARGASYLLVKDMQAQHGMTLLQLAGQDPELRAELDMPEVYKTVVSFLDVPSDRLFKTDEQKQQEAESQGQQQQIEQQMFEADLRLKAAQAMKAEAEAQRAMTPPEGNEMEIQIRMQEMEAKLMIAQMERDARLAAAAADKDIRLADLQASLQTKQKDLELRRYIEELKVSARAQEAERKEFADGMKTRLQIEKQAQRDQNLRMGFDTF